MRSASMEHHDVEGVRPEERGEVDHMMHGHHQSHGDPNGNLVLFGCWVIDSKGDFWLAVLSVLLLAFAQEWLRWLKAGFDRKATSKTETDAKYPSPTWPWIAFCGLLHVTLAFASYALMLVVMALDAALCAAVAAGLFAGRIAVLKWGKRSLVGRRVVAVAAAATADDRQMAQEDFGCH